MNKGFFVLAALLLIGIAAGLWYALSREEVAVVDATSADVLGIRTIDLFLPDANGDIVSEPREIVGTESVPGDLRRALEELIAGGSSGLRPIPAGTELLNVFTDGQGEVTINFSEHLRSDHPGGSRAELATLRCIVSTVGANFPGVDRVRILIEGETIDTLVGHVPLDRAVAVRDYR